ncbi:MAG: copper amine oxidase N-terminal domain-containing protein [Candidatus Eremiobacteraeota bacterium]|nr:copper amine oxidase N-terminal domain-containing protein [Candidatus Eremiobacteraeota bacterium]
MKIYQRCAGFALALVFAAAANAAIPAAAATVSVSVNGQGISFDQPPIERAGRVFVPLRGVFERLGASVVYANGLINATGNGHNVSLHIGSTAATVNGQTIYSDVAPFIIGSRTLVPLRFVAQALGAAVDYNGSNHSVSITGGGGAVNNAPTTNQSFYLNDKRPATRAYSLTPAIHAAFSEPINRDSLHVAVDGRDVTAQVYGSATGFDVTAPFALTAGTNRVRVTGTTQAGAQFNTGWTFVSSSGGAANFINRIRPGNGTQVQSSFTLRGHTLPNSTVKVLAKGSASALGGFLQVDTGTFQTQVTADANGNFAVPVATNTPSGGHIQVVIVSTAPDGASHESTLSYSV